MKIAAVVAVAVILLVGGCVSACYRNLNETRADAPDVWRANGFEVISYEGYQGDPVLGARVWHVVRRVPDNGILYHGFVVKWFNEYHIYNLRALDAIKP